MSKVVILVGSMRKGGNTEALAKSFADGAKIHNEVVIISVADYNVNPCRGCNACYSNKDNTCIQNDDMQKIYSELKDADVLVVASPVYFYGISSSLKAIIDRLHTPMRNTFKIRRLGLLLVGATKVPNLFESIEAQYDSVLRFFELQDVGRILVNGVKDIGDITGNAALEEARRLGESII
jgi:NAD(P)H-dependent FMN reductase